MTSKFRNAHSRFFSNHHVWCIPNFSSHCCIFPADQELNTELGVHRVMYGLCAQHGDCRLGGPCAGVQNKHSCSGFSSKSLEDTRGSCSKSLSNLCLGMRTMKKNNKPNDNKPPSTPALTTALVISAGEEVSKCLPVPTLPQ